jgi:hypothetical protein
MIIFVIWLTLAKPFSYLKRSSEAFQTFEGRLNNIVGIVGSNTLGQYITNSHSLHNGPHSASGNHTGAGTCGFKKDFGRSIFPCDFMRHCTVHYWHVYQIRFGSLNTFANSLGNFIRFAQAEPYAALTIANDDNSAKRKSSSAFYDFGDAT